MAIRIKDIGGSFARRRIHPHVQRTVVAVGKTPVHLI